MPIVRTVKLACYLVRFSLDVQAMTANAVFQNTIDGKPTELFEIEVAGPDLANLLSAVPDSGKTRADDITDAVYAYAVDKGLVKGVIS